MRPKILLIGDDSVEVEKVQASLRRAQFLVVTAAPTRTGLRLAKTQRPALVVLCLNGNKVSPVKFAQSLRRALGTTRIIFLPPEGEEIPAAENQTVLERPATTRRILYHVRKAFRDAPPALTLGDLTLDYENRCVWNGGERGDLTPMQFKLLEFFMMRPGRDLSKKEILQVVWETPHIGYAQSLYVHVCWLRAKLRNIGCKRQYIKTVRGIGYRFGPFLDSDA
jgi:DNA-binding response OmpR family regulator